MNGVNNATTFIDESGKAWTATGDAKISTAQSKWNGSSGLFNAGGIYTPYHTDFDLGSANFRLAGWFKTAQTTAYATLISKSPGAFGTGMWSLLTSNTSAGDLAFYIYEYSSSTPMLLTAGSLINTNNWVHIALVRYGNIWTIYVGGISKATRTTATTVTALNARVYFGQDQNYTRYYVGYGQELFFSKDVGSWTSDFAVPTKPYQPYKAIAHMQK
jgi:hypothetical protein